MEARHDSAIRNSVTNAGGKTHDPSTHTRPNLGAQRLSAEECSATFRFNPWAKRVITTTASHCVRRGWTVSIGDGDAAKKVAEACAKRERQIHLRQRLARADVLGWGILGGSGVVMRIPNGSQDEPVIPSRQSRIAGLTVFWGEDLYPDNTSVITDALREDFGEPSHYLLATGQRAVFNVEGKQQTRFEASRVLTMTGERLWGSWETDTPSGGLWRYDSAISAGWDALRALGTIEAGVERAVHTLRMTALKLPLVKMLEDPENGGEAALRRRMQSLYFGFSSFNLALLDSDSGEELIVDNLDLRGAIDIVHHYVDKLCMTYGFPRTLLVGQSPGGLSTDDKSGVHNWAASTNARQVERYEPNIAKVWRLLAAEQGATDADVQVKFAPLIDQDEKAEAEIQKLIAETSMTYYQLDGVEDPRGIVDRVVQGGPEPANAGPA